MTAICPDAMPVLRTGRHGHPREGACVMEYAAVLAGEPFGDHPQCVHPALATLARSINDGIRDDRVRSGLALLAPDLIAVDERDPRVGRQVVRTCLLAAAAIAPLKRSTAKQLAKASNAVRKPVPDGWWRRLGLRCRAACAPPEIDVRKALAVFNQHAAIDPRDQDRRLVDLLGAVVLDCVQLTDPHRGNGRRSRPTLA